MNLPIQAGGMGRDYFHPEAGLLYPRFKNAKFPKGALETPCLEPMQVLKPPGEPNAARLSLVCSDLASLLAGFTHFSQSPPLISGSPALWQGKHSSLFTVRRGSALASLFTDLPALKTMDTLMPNLSLKFFFTQLATVSLVVQLRDQL